MLHACGVSLRDKMGVRILEQTKAAVGKDKALSLLGRLVLLGSF